MIHPYVCSHTYVELGPTCHIVDQVILTFKLWTPVH